MKESEISLLQRIVRLSFEPEKVEDFLLIFRESAPLIRRFPGCRGLQLWRDAEAPNVLYTYSLWQDAEALEAYRRSDLFVKTWAATKKLFNDKPRAWSALPLIELP